MLEMDSPGSPPDSVLAYIEEMLRELAGLARTLPQPALAAAIDVAGAVAQDVVRREDSRDDAALRCRRA